MGWQWHQLDHMQIICTLLQTNNPASSTPLNFLQAGCVSWCPTNSVKALKAIQSTEGNLFTVQLEYILVQLWPGPLEEKLQG